jgi:hypothetical protein
MGIMEINPYGTDALVDEWERSRQLLLAKERQLAQFEVRGASDETAAERLVQLRCALEELREVVDRKFVAAFTRKGRSGPASAAVRK